MSGNKQFILKYLTYILYTLPFITSYFTILIRYYISLYAFTTLVWMEYIMTLFAAQVFVL